MEKMQEIEWQEAQKIEFSVDLVDAAKKQLEFLAAVDRNRHLHEGPALQWAIFRYNAFWLPLLAKHSKNPVSEEPLVVPLDCEWIWHCHRLNPIRYKFDCQKLFGRILDNENVISSVQGTSKSKTEEIWKNLYPEEPYELDSSRHLCKDILPRISYGEIFTSYDLVSAVTRQLSFFFQVSRPHMSNDLFLQEAVARYRGFLHLVRTNRKKNIRVFCVPTYDIDLIWHSHQLHPVSYCKDLLKLVGEVVGHDDTDSDRTKGKKLDTGFSEITKQWEQTFGLRYWKAGAMYRGATPTPVTHIPFPFSSGKELDPTSNNENLIQFHALKVVEVMLEFVKIKNLSKGKEGNLFVSFSKKQPDKFFSTKRTLGVSSDSKEKQVVFFECEPTGEFLFELVSHIPTNKEEAKSFTSLGSCSLSLQELLASKVQLSFDKRLLMIPVSSPASSQPILHVSISFTIPTPAPRVYHLVRAPGGSKSLHAESWTCVIDDEGNDVMSLQMRNLKEDMKNSSDLMEVYYVTDSGETHTLASFVGNKWCIMGTNGSFKLLGSSGNNGDLFKLVGDKMVKIFPGRRLDYEPKHCKKQRSEQDFVTAVEFSSEHPYGRAVGLIDFRSLTFKVKDEWMVQLGITLTFILSSIQKREGYSAFTAMGSMMDMINQVTTLAGNTESQMEAKEGMTKSARCFINGVKGGTENNMEAKEEMIESARCFINGVKGGTENKMEAKEEMIESARCFVVAIESGAESNKEAKEEMIKSARCFINGVKGREENKMEAKEKMIKSARCFSVGIESGGESEMEANKEMIKSARCFSATKESKAESKMETKEEMMKGASCAKCYSCGVKIVDYGTGGTCNTGGCSITRQVKNGACGVKSESCGGGICRVVNEEKSAACGGDCVDSSMVNEVNTAACIAECASVVNKEKTAGCVAEYASMVNEVNNAAYCIAECGPVVNKKKTAGCVAEYTSMVNEVNNAACIAECASVVNKEKSAACIAECASVVNEEKSAKCFITCSASFMVNESIAA